MAENLQRSFMSNESDKNAALGFPPLKFVDEEPPTRPSPLHDKPLPAQIDRHMTTIEAQHPRIAAAIKTFWGHNDCDEYLQLLITSGGDGMGNARVGFKQEILAALISLSSLHTHIRRQ
jgi:hypothetical protein